MPKQLLLKGKTLGGGKPLICVPITGSEQRAIEKQMAAAISSGAGLVEWRIDHYTNYQNTKDVCLFAERLLQITDGIPLLLTLRSTAEGGHNALGPEATVALLHSLTELRPSAIDFELSLGEAACRELAVAAEKMNVLPIISSHNFSKTPAAENMLSLFDAMRNVGGECAVPKLAVMPHCAADTLSLMQVVRCFADRDGGPVIAMAMGGLGAVSRVAGELFGSCITFGTCGDASAPGQLPVDKLKIVLEILHRAKEEA